MTKDEIMSLINRSLFASVGYTDSSGKQNIRRVFCVWHDGIGKHLISTNTSSSHVREFMKNGNACLYFSDDDTFEGICLSGNIKVHFEKEFKQLLWNDGDEKYYSKGVDDEDYCVLEFIAETGKYYRYDGKGELSKEEMQGTGTFINGYAG